MTPDAALGARIAEARKAREMSQYALAADVAARSGKRWQQVQISRVENGERPVRAVELGAFADSLGLSIDALLGRNLTAAGLPASILSRARDLHRLLGSFVYGEAT